MLQDYSIENAEGGRTEFTGELLATQDSHYTSNQHRWTEISIYRTQAGKYIVHKVGRTTRPGEVDRHTVHVSGTAAGCVESCYTQDDDESIYLTSPARRALKMSATKDDAIRDAYLVQRVD